MLEVHRPIAQAIDFPQEEVRSQSFGLCLWRECRLRRFAGEQMIGEEHCDSSHGDNNEDDADDERGAFHDAGNRCEIRVRTSSSVSMNASNFAGDCAFLASCKSEADSSKNPPVEIPFFASCVR